MILLMLISNFAIAQQKIPVKESIPKGGLLNKKIKGTIWYFDTFSIDENKLDLNGNAGPDIVNFIDENKFLITLEDQTTLSGTYQIFDLQDMGVHHSPAKYKTFKINKVKDPGSRAKKLTVFLEQKLNVHYDLDQRVMDFISDQVQPIAPAN
ncbi:hypothetical protein [Chryseobacterium luquanense]|uniref:DUF4369 domain-containing protein n=1 Tax=Chryseobacterium luquanense TaxID=2983766 RepID=A0ABT3XYD4_9FLAO|nr:hypothetical protein [Chryseobacterium luquanense]MCX8530895.1 hypothetical protein [Chryseobacterium luquanense]